MSTIVLEFNELSPTLLDRFIAAGHLPNFKRLRNSALVAVTDAEEAAPNLEPWIQWVTAHTGLSYAEHGCFKLNDGAALSAPRIWDLVSRSGRTNWICGSMNAAVQAGFLGHFLPDPWATEPVSLPDGHFEPYTHLVRSYVQEHSAQPDVSPLDFARFGRFMLTHGLSAQSVLAAIAQLVQERADNVKWRRAMILDRLQWDLFRSIYRNEKPHFSTFFINSTAHFQHFHWREFEPELFGIQPSEQDFREHRDTVLEGYRNMDRLVGQALAMTGGDDNLVLLTALSQQPMLTHEEDGGRQIFRHRDIARLMAFAGVAPGWRYAPVMSQQFLLHFESEQAAITAAERIEALRLSDGRQPMWARREGLSLDAGCMVEQYPAKEIVVLSLAANEAVGFFDLFYPLEALRSGKHHPDGAFWIKGPGIQPRRLADRVSLRTVAPTLAELTGVEGQFSMRSILVSMPMEIAA
ncbi:alkaline phosphatase family protein [Novosphingobium kaempferiae]|uniref:alkaline phosphatase family protein n=1 Tax=Novosphingobium kaempferiae TaxID=2896849 RepID=UPI001E485F83|nr:alkaline phosphatase family protein [Novosphingobium kaempferiae]